MAVEDLYDATAFIVDKADEWGIDSSQIVACGSSAGAITVLHGEYALCNASPLVQHLPAGFRYAGIVSFAGAIFEMGEELRWASQPAPMMLFHGDADANVPYNVIPRAAPVSSARSTSPDTPRDELPVLFLFGRERLTRHRHGADGRQRDAIDAFLSKLVVDKEPLMIETDETTIGAPEVRKNFTLAEYIASNFCKKDAEVCAYVRIGLDLCRLDNDAMCPMSMLGDGSATDCCREYSVWSFRCCSDCG